MHLIYKSNYISLIYPSGEVQYLFSIHKLKFKLSLNFNYIMNLCDFDNIILNCKELISTKEAKIKKMVKHFFSLQIKILRYRLKVQALKMTHYFIEQVLLIKATTIDNHFNINNIFYNIT